LTYRTTLAGYTLTPPGRLAADGLIGDLVRVPCGKRVIAEGNITPGAVPPGHGLGVRPTVVGSAIRGVEITRRRFVEALAQNKT
jgi:putative N-acetylmannosamine-6-phosphate epimerase